MLGTLSVDIEEIGLFQSLGQSGSVCHVVELYVAQNLCHLVGGTEIQLNEVYALILQVTGAAATSYCSPYLHTL